MDRYICIHGHFYQPPRENPWLESIEVQDSAYPYHDWNERITAECYAPNARSRILDGENRIIELLNNYASISFDFGPTLLSWLERNAPDVYRSILEADHESRRTYSGHGSAMALAYNHMILPLGRKRDKQTQVCWGIRDFEHRFGRRPEGMWLPETAVDKETLGIMAEGGIKFTVLSPHQAESVRMLGGRGWRDVTGGSIDPSMPYLVRLPGKRSISIFFYDGPISSSIAFQGLLNRGDHFAERLAGAFSPARTWPQIIHVATDGETYGHHHKLGDMALAYALRYIRKQNLARLTNYGEFLERHPPFEEVRIQEKSSWSCVHGLGRWCSPCGCCTGARPGWNQEWRAPLRAALDWLRDTIAPLFERQAGRLLADPWEARNDYISVVLDRSSENVESFFARRATHALKREEKVRALKLLEMQRHAMLMYTSCGWFFDELSGIETVQVMQYAGRTLQLAAEVFQANLEPRFLDMLERAKSNVAEHRNGKRIYERLVRPAMVDLPKVGAHYALSSLFNQYGEVTRTYAFTVKREDYQTLEQGRARLAVGRATVTSDITRESAELSFGVVHLGQQSLTAGVGRVLSGGSHEDLVRDITTAFENGDFAGLVRLLDQSFETGSYSLKLLFKDEQRRIINRILEDTMREAETTYRNLFINYAPLMRYITMLGVPLPRHLEIAAEYTFNTDLRRALEQEDLDIKNIDSLLKETRRAGLKLDETALEFALRKNIERMAASFRAQPEDMSRLSRLDAAVTLAGRLPFKVQLWRTQNDYCEILDTFCRDLVRKPEGDSVCTRTWLEQFRALGQKLSIYMP